MSSAICADRSCTVNFRVSAKGRVRFTVSIRFRVSFRIRVRV